MRRTFSNLPALALSALISAAATSDTPPVEVQVLLLGDNPESLRRALVAAGGRITHELPVVSGIGGVLPSTQLDVLAEHPDVGRVIEDFNPVDDPEPRDCELAGDVQAELSGRRFVWRLHNFSDRALTVTSLTLAWPAKLGAVNDIRLDGKPTLDARLIGDGNVKLDWPQSLAPGPQSLELVFERALADVSQNDFEISVVTADCSADLLPAYDNNSGDFYYSRVVGADRLHAEGITGAGVTVAVLDSGLWEHPALTKDTGGRPRITARFDAVTNTEPDTMSDESGHGTHMTSVLAHSGAAVDGDVASFKGVAPDAGIVPVKVFTADGSGDFLDIIRGIQWVIAHRAEYNIRVLNLSLAAVPRFYYWDDPINQAVLKAWQAGITVIAAAGNEGPGWSSVGSPGNNPYVITVGAVTDSWTPNARDDDYIPEFSSRGPTATGHIKPDIVAPGGHITGIVPPGSTLALENPNYFLRSGEYVSTGSSQAAAVVSGIAALLLQLEPTLSNDDIKCMLTSSAEPAINRDGRLAYSPFEQGAGYINATRAITLGERGCGNVGLDIAAAVAGKEKLYGPAEATEEGEPTLPDLDRLLSPTPAAEGLSEERRWGVKAHVERLDLINNEPTQVDGVPVDWARAYELERRRIEALSSD